MASRKERDRAKIAANRAAGKGSKGSSQHPKSKNPRARLLAEERKKKLQKADALARRQELTREVNPVTGKVGRGGKYGRKDQDIDPTLGISSKEALALRESQARRAEQVLANNERIRAEGAQATEIQEGQEPTIDQAAELSRTGKIIRKLSELAPDEILFDESGNPVEREGISEGEAAQQLIGTGLAGAGSLGTAIGVGVGATAGAGAAQEAKAANAIRSSRNTVDDVYAKYISRMDPENLGDASKAAGGVAPKARTLKGSLDAAKNSKTWELTKKAYGIGLGLTKTGIAAGGVYMSYKGTLLFSRFINEEAMQSVSFALSQALKAKDLEGAQEAMDLMEKILNPESLTWFQKINFPGQADKAFDNFEEAASIYLKVNQKNFEALQVELATEAPGLFGNQNPDISRSDAEIQLEQARRELEILRRAQ